MRSVRGRGFTLIEIVLTVASMGVISMAVVLSSLQLLRANDLDLAVAATTQQLRAAQLNARASNGDAPWGISISTSTITLFRGANFASRDSAADQVTEIASTITPSGLTEIVFAKNTGWPTSSGTIVLTHDVIGQKQLTINSLGLIDEVPN